MFWIAARRNVTQGPPIAIDCPSCRATATPSRPQYVEEPLLLFHLIPLVTLRSTFIVCGACGETLSIRSRGLDGLGALSTREFSALLRPYVSGVGRFLVISALALFWFPFLAPFLALGGLYMTRRHRGWRRLAIVAVILSLLIAVPVAALLIFGPTTNGRR